MYFKVNKSVVKVERLVTEKKCNIRKKKLLKYSNRALKQSTLRFTHDFFITYIPVETDITFLF